MLMAENETQKAINTVCVYLQERLIMQFPLSKWLMMLLVTHYSFKKKSPENNFNQDQGLIEISLMGHIHRFI